jgi:hypothetical protein
MAQAVSRLPTAAEALVRPFSVGFMVDKLALAQVSL